MDMTELDLTGRVRAAVLTELRDTMVVAVDDSSPAGMALRFAAYLARDTRTPLHVLMIWNVIIGPAPESTDQPLTEQDGRTPPNRASQRSSTNLARQLAVAAEMPRRARQRQLAPAPGQRGRRAHDRRKPRTWPRRTGAPRLHQRRARQSCVLPGHRRTTDNGALT